MKFVMNRPIDKLQAKIDRIGPPPEYVIILIVIIALGIGAYSFRFSNAKGAEDLLFSQAAGRDFRSSQQAQAAIQKLATYRDAHSTALLLDIAQGNTVFQFNDLQIQALKALKGRSDVQLSSGVAMLIQPHQGLNLREAAAEDLQDRYCDHECLRLIMHYLERVWRGEPNFEDHWNKEIPPEIRDEQAKVIQELLSILRRESRETTVMLSITYGLDTSAPSPFALELVKRAELTSACAYLLKSSQDLHRLPPDFFRAPRAEIQQALDSLHCGTQGDRR